MNDDAALADEEIRFADEADSGRSSGEAWLILIVDDEPDVHSMTSLILSDLRYHNRPLKLLNAHSAAEAKQLLEHFPHIAVALVDVVMEEDHAGLHLVRDIRHELHNSEIRLILRTGQPGQAPQRQVVLDYDINDYRSKAELTADDLVISTIAALRSYEHIVSIETKVAERTRELLESREHLNAAKNLAEQATRAKSAFLATMSHEIRTPMNGVLGMLELLERSHLETQQAETVSTIRESATALLRIIDDILDFSKIEAEKLVLEEVPVSIAAIVEGVAETLSPSAWRKELDLLT